MFLAMAFFAVAARLLGTGVKINAHSPGGDLFFLFLPPLVLLAVGAGIAVLFGRIWLLVTIALLPPTIVCASLYLLFIGMSACC